MGGKEKGRALAANFGSSHGYPMRRPHVRNTVSHAAGVHVPPDAEPPGHEDGVMVCMSRHVATRTGFTDGRLGAPLLKEMLVRLRWAVKTERLPRHTKGLAILSTIWGSDSTSRQPGGSPQSFTYTRAASATSD
ncbi:hypothetical protein R1flu_004772 [Riccia fluitans]|uniref:Uncharacterized protein n=1 Tax=Riccia fluitans TaxID=41844 RepID=A0ABD1YRV7_9MARC